MASGLESPSLNGIMKALAAAVKEGGSASIRLIILIRLILFSTPRKAFIYAGLRIWGVYQMSLGRLPNVARVSTKCR